MTLNAKIGDFVDFWRFWAATQVYIIHKVAPRTELSLCDPDKEFGICIYKLSVKTPIFS